jgi:hypothetical protein
MLPYVSLIIFAIHAAIKVGQKIRTVFEEEVRDRDLFLPPVGFTPANLPYWDETENFFLGTGTAWPHPKPGRERRSRPQPPPGLFYDLWQQRKTRHPRKIVFCLPEPQG